MFQGISNLASIMKQAQEFRGKMEEVQGSLKMIEVTGEAGAGMVIVTANAQQQILKCQIDPSLLAQNDQELLEELIVAATNTALENAKQAASEKMSELTNGLNIPGIQDALSQFGGMPQ